jgi:hypothetical protein
MLHQRASLCWRGATRKASQAPGTSKNCLEQYKGTCYSTVYAWGAEGALLRLF